MDFNPTDLKIIKFCNQGCSIERIAKKIGRPNDIERVKDTLKRAGLTPKVKCTCVFYRETHPGTMNIIDNRECEVHKPVTPNEI